MPKPAKIHYTMDKKKSLVSKSIGVPVTVALHEATAERLGTTLSNLRKSGFTVTHNLEESGVLIGRCLPENLPALRSVVGVAAVEQEREFELPPPESVTQ